MTTVNVNQLLGESDLPVVDVRSPSEFRRGHIRGAVSIPLFDDSERAEIGTLYKQVGRAQAVDRGLEIASAKSDWLIRNLRDVAPKSEFVLHCWRGGMRSRGVAWLCADCGLNPKLLQGGYKAFRQAVHRSFSEPRRVIVLAGQTGTGKTQLLQHLRARGQQVIDLEALANHRGSVFGGIGRTPQPTVEQFENDLFCQWRELDSSKPVWIEGESQAIGTVNIPQPVWQQMSAAPTIFVDADRESRIDFLLDEYAGLESVDLASAAQRIKKRLGGARLSAALQAIDGNDRRTFASIVLEYYDKSYSQSLLKRPRDAVTRFQLSVPGDAAAVTELVALAGQMMQLPSVTDREPECRVG